MKHRVFPEVAYLGIKAAWRRLFTLCGGIESSAAITRVRPPTISSYGQTQRMMEFPPSDIIADLEAEAGEPIVTRYLAELQGYVLVKLPDVPGGEVVSIRHLGDLGKEAGEVMQKLSQALADDGVVSRRESRELELRREVNEALTVLAQLARALERIEWEGGR